jgi:hypothetical protein
LPFKRFSGHPFIEIGDKNIKNFFKERKKERLGEREEGRRRKEERKLPSLICARV